MVIKYIAETSGEIGTNKNGTGCYKQVVRTFGLGHISVFWIIQCTVILSLFSKCQKCTPYFIAIKPKRRRMQKNKLNP